MPSRARKAAAVSAVWPAPDTGRGAGEALGGTPCYSKEREGRARGGGEG
jgi:hypothetical protein